MAQAPDTGLTGLAVMGQNLARNVASRGIPIVVHNRTGATTEKFLAELDSSEPITGSDSLGEFVQKLARPRKIIIMVKAGKPVDAVLDDLLPLLDAGDVVMDGGNSFYRDTERREQRAAEHGVHFLGVGISGGEEGALKGPSIMPGGKREAYDLVEPMLTSIAAKAADGVPCCTYIGPGGAGHYVKMVHNGIEYADIQLIAEAYDLPLCWRSGTRRLGGRLWTSSWTRPSRKAPAAGRPRRHSSWAYRCPASPPRSTAARSPRVAPSGNARPGFCPAPLPRLSRTRASSATCGMPCTRARSAHTRKASSR
jgi:3-hydroxyisobutyrate dehydrogenase-like beta-hydroxyacid dehydrogenase